MAECRALERKIQKVMKSDMLYNQTGSSYGDLRQYNQLQDVADDMARSFVPFISEGSVYLVGKSTKTPVKILRDTGTSQSLILERVLPFSSKLFSGSSRA